jgi:hypothetical protein
LLGLLTIAVQAERIIPLSIEELTARAELVLQGTVLSKSCQRDAAGRIYTSIEFQVAEVWKGRLTTNRITLVHGGGILGEERLHVDGQVNFRLGEEAAVFLVLNPQGEGVAIGMCQGKFNIWKDPDSGQKVTDNGFHGRAAARVPDAQKALAPPTSRPLGVAELKQRVQGGRQ